jgi:DNA-binding FadR family transcriptional regulator
MADRIVAFPRSGSVRVPKAAELVAADLRRQIIRTTLQVGDPLPSEAALMEIYDVSRPTLREALRILENEGLISVKRGAHGGARVQFPDVTVAARYAALLLQIRNTPVEDVFQARRILEPAAVRMLAERRGRSALKTLRKKHEAEELLVDDPDRFATSASEFHQMLVDLAGNNTLAVFTGMLFEIVDKVSHGTVAAAPEHRHEFTHVGAEHHGHVIELIAAGAADEAEAFWQFHIDGAAERTLRAIGPKTIVDLLD